MKIKIAVVKKDTTSYGNKYWIQIEDTENTSHNDMETLVDKKVCIVIGPVSSIDNFIQETSIL